MSNDRSIRTSDPRQAGLKRPIVAVEYATAYDDNARNVGAAERAGHCLKRAVLEEDFMYDAGDTLISPWAIADTSAAGSPTLDFVADAANGQFTLTLAASDESEILTLYLGDDVYIPITSNPVFYARLKVNAAAIPWTADQRFVAGLASARNDTLDSVATHAWIRVEGASANILLEGDDGTTDTDGQDSGADLMDDTFIDVVIDCHDLSDVRFFIDGQYRGSVAIAAATGNVQPIFEIQKDGGTETEALVIDYCKVVWDR